MILADEINRTPPKTQAALLEAMQEGPRHRRRDHLSCSPSRSSCWRRRIPIEQEGTYPLPEAQQDRFMFNIRVDYPSRLEEIAIMKATTGTAKTELQPLIEAKQILQFQQVVRQVVVADHIFAYCADLVRTTRPKEKEVPKWVPELISWGAGPRACQFLILGGKARAVLHGRVHVTTEDIRAVAYPVLRHRILTTFHADADGITTDDIIRKLIDTTPVPLEAKRL